MTNLGILTPMIANTPEVDHDILVGLMSDFCRAGGKPTLTEWVTMSEGERAALIDAREIVFTEMLETLASSVTPDAKDVAAKIAEELAT